MTENHSKSKLKRKKCSVGDQQAEACSGAARSSRQSSPAEAARRPVDPAAVWWNRERLPAVECLWALTLKSALPCLENQRCYLVPDLPQPSSAKHTVLELNEQWWCDLSEDVAPFPSPRTSSSPDPPRLRSSHPAANTADRQLFSYSTQNHNKQTASPQAPTRRLCSWEGAQSAAVESDGQVSLQKEGENKEQVVGDVEEVQMSARGDGETVGGGGGGLQSCPMCLLVFPAGFTQMDCDGHLAQCLSEVNVDVTW